MIQIEDPEEFAEKLAHVLGAVDKLKRSGTTTSPELFEHMLDEFLAQYALAPTALPREQDTISAGFVVTVRPSGAIPHDFQGITFGTEGHAVSAIKSFVHNRGYGSPSDYEIKEVTYLA